MNITTQTKYFEQLVDKMRDVMLKKGNDYANEDRLSNFKFAGQIAGISAERQCLSLIAVKVARLGNLLDKDAHYESIEDSCLDLANYAVLLSMILAEKNLDNYYIDSKQ